jgi:hypothetical protein
MLNEIMNNLSDLNEPELRALNKAVIDRMKSLRNREAALKRRTLRAGDRVSWDGRRGYTEGTIVRVKRKKAICDVGSGRNWDVPLNMLTAVKAS